jgi:hypothetical protein
MKTALVFCMAFAAAGSVARAQDGLTAARDLYAAASYEEALAQLDRASAAGADLARAREIEQYRAFCFFALGRTRDAEATLEALIRKDPLVALDRRDASPRIEGLFTDVRNRLLPDLIREEYRRARALVQQGSAEAAGTLERVKAMIALAAQTEIYDETLADLGMLVDGFLELHIAAVEPSAPAGNAGASLAPIAHPAAPAGPDAAPPARSDPAGAAAWGDRPVGTSGTAVVEPPVAISQSVPVIPANLRSFIPPSKRFGTYDVLITESGTVRDVVVRESVSPRYDSVFVRTARTWKYRPATRDGQPVVSVKTITVHAGKE